ncbi:peptide ABC transporter permease [Alishewanella sp. WH16-1]|jgi:putative ABC transport system permease protein|uniref:FtsX-like permease family protein n=1 Tax=Alishewanella sp. WH16-1 TaxID=1651088 RepID=UPI00070E2F60|nr:FtsX-like permease family protein [Alishewanella sp. WH16-1]KRS19979.1 peptide ABC transporter permease [Alishewanella sp. WH16-1]
MSFSLLLKSLLRRKVITALLLVQLALTLALLTNSAVLAWQARQLANQDTGLQLDQLLRVPLKPTLPELRQQPALDELISRQLAAVQSMPGVVAVSWSNQSPLVFGGMNGNIFVPERQDTTDVGMVPVQINGIAVKEVLDLPLLQGRWLEETDQGTDALVISDKLAKRLFGEQSPVGQAVSRGTVVGVVADVFMQRYADDQYYASYSYYSLPGADYGYQLLVKTAPGQLEQVRQQLPQVLRGVELETDIGTIQSFRELHQTLFRSESGLATLLAVLSALMLLVAMISAYSHALFHGVQQQKEIGIKRALGASRPRIMLEVLTESWLTTLTGAAAGVLLALLLQQQLSKVLSMPALPWYLLPLTVLLLLLCVSLATWYPARLATRVSPATATKTL